ncbi:hypothetical protein TNIN_70132 [Trichonephila inaurata madagascariensis]|uniref:Uncharacterized protein n=1 Tax=Trichonephila inaurata madagascariensis TaxID=2747483 RepID=A0A8X6XZE9_9ARAC|nr:hypothetical protein TNIN_70132 [Trichonephila inaurata madagascariensis]
MQWRRIFLSLQQMCLSKIAVSVFNDPDIKHFRSTHCIHSYIWSSEEIEAFLGNEPGALFNYARVYDITFNASSPVTIQCKHFFTGNGKDHSLPKKQWVNLVGQKISTLPLPNIMKKEVTVSVQLLLTEFDKWLHDQARIMDSSMNNMMDTANLLNNIHWTQDNNIDRQKTAKAIIADNNIDIRYRFRLASFYCFQDDMSSLWRLLNIWQQYSCGAECIFEMGILWLRDGADGVIETIDNILELFADIRSGSHLTTFFQEFYPYCIEDTDKSTPEKIVLRINLENEEEGENFKNHYFVVSNTNWIVYVCTPNPQRHNR